MIGLPPSRLRRVAAAAAPLIAGLLLVGCENRWEYARYPESLSYPFRSDPIVTAAPTQVQPFSPEPPGRLDESIAALSDPKLGGKLIDPKGLPPELRGALSHAVNDLFGTPRRPRVGGNDAGKDVVDQLVALKVRDDDPKNPFKTLAKGSELFRYHCVHCHGLTGDGRGPTGPWLDPHPRDYRHGAFKFISSDFSIAGRKPRRDDLLRTLRMGIDGTSMPSFRLLSDEELDALASYVIHLSMRGQVEEALIEKSPAPVGDGSITKKEEFAQAARDAFSEDANGNVLQQWTDSNTKPPITPAKGAFVENMSHKDKEQSIRHGWQLFSDPKGSASCISCHADYGRQVNYKYDVWGTLVRPRDLTGGNYRGGRRPIDLYWRIKGGIESAGMARTGLTDDKDIWDVVNFVQALPYPQMLPEDVRTAVYDRPPDEQAGSEHAER